jgi:hypothetical protein
VSINDEDRRPRLKVAKLHNVCPRCLRPTLRTFVEVGLMIPTSMVCRLTKTKLRSRLVELQSADWSQAKTRCYNSTCNYGWKPPRRSRKF